MKDSNDNVTIDFLDQPFMLSWTTSSGVYSEYFDSISDIADYIHRHEMLRNDNIKDLFLSDVKSGYAFQIVNIL